MTSISNDKSNSSTSASGEQSSFDALLATIQSCPATNDDPKRAGSGQDEASSVSTRQGDVDIAFARLRSALELVNAALAQKTEALEAVKALVEAGAINPEKDSKGTFRGDGVQVIRSASTRWEETMEAKSKINELKGDLRKTGLIKQVSGEDKWTPKLL